MALEDRWSELSEERKAKMRACKTPEELLSVAREEGYELTDDELEAVAGSGLMARCLSGVRDKGQGWKAKPGGLEFSKVKHKLITF